MIVKCTEDEGYSLTKGKEYKVIQVTDNNKLLQVINDDGEIEWYPVFIFNY